MIKDPYRDVCNFVKASPKTRREGATVLFSTAQNHINSLKYFSVFLLNCKIRHASSTWKELIRKSLCLPIFRNITETVKEIKSLYGFRGRYNKLQTFVWIVNHVLRVIT